MKYLSLFSGIGGFELGIQQAYDLISSTKREQQGRIENNMSINGEQLLAPQCIGYSEIDKYATQIYQKHFPNHKNYGDITKIDASTLPEFDVLVGGFPCQAFSIAGKRGGFADTRGTLFFEIARIAREKQPRLLLLENVKGLLSHDKGRTFLTIITTLDELGYDVQWQVLNSKNHGVPQNRERVFIIGHLRGRPRPEIFPFGESSQEPVGETDKQGCANTLTGRSAGGQNKRGNYIKISKSGSVKKDQQNAATLTGGAHSGGNHSDMDLIVKIPEATKKGYAEAEEGDSINLSVMGSKTRRGRVGKKIAQTVDTGMQQHTLQHGSIRRLTPKECERLQGFPDGWTGLGANWVVSEKGNPAQKFVLISDTQRYKTIGNAVTVNVIRDIFYKLIK